MRWCGGDNDAGLPLTFLSRRWPREGLYWSVVGEEVRWWWCDGVMVLQTPSQPGG
jgi:hypothetical protein